MNTSEILECDLIQGIDSIDPSDGPVILVCLGGLREPHKGNKYPKLSYTILRIPFSHLGKKGTACEGVKTVQELRDDIWKGDHMEDFNCYLSWFDGKVCLENLNVCAFICW